MRYAGAFRDAYNVFRRKAARYVRKRHKRGFKPYSAFTGRVIYLGRRGLRGYFQGHGNMLPTAMSQVLEAASRLFIGLLIAYLMITIRRGRKIRRGGNDLRNNGGNNSFRAFAFGSFIYFKRKPAPREESEPDNYKEKSGGKLFEGLLKIAVPVTIGALIMNLTSAIDMFFITNRLAV